LAMTLCRPVRVGRIAAWHGDGLADCAGPLEAVTFQLDQEVRPQALRLAAWQPRRPTRCPRRKIRPRPTGRGKDGYTSELFVSTAPPVPTEDALKRARQESTRPHGPTGLGDPVLRLRREPPAEPIGESYLM